MGAQQLTAPSPEQVEKHYGSWVLAIIMGVISVAFLVLAVSAPLWAEAEVETLGVNEYMAQATF